MVANVVRFGEANLIEPLSLASVHCMAEMTLSFETRESEHNYKNDTKEEVTALCVSVTTFSLSVGIFVLIIVLTVVVVIVTAVVVGFVVQL